MKLNSTFQGAKKRAAADLIYLPQPEIIFQ